MNRRLALPVLVAATVVSLAGCDNSTGGSASPGTGPTGSSPSRDGDSSSGTASLKPCDLLSSSAISQNNLTSLGSKTEGGARTCGWRHAIGADESPGYTISIGIRDSQGLGDSNSDGENVSQDDIGGHSGEQLEQTGGTACTVALGVTSSSRVDVTAASTSGDMSQSCRVANQFAAMIAPSVPSGN